MSYRALKDILGETSLERKCRFLFGLCLLLLITGSFWWYGSRTENLVYTSTRTTGRHLVDAVMLHHHWKTLEADKKYTTLIETLGQQLQSQPYTWTILRPDAAGDEQASYTSLDTAVLDYFDDPEASGTTLPPPPAESPVLSTESGEYREFRTADNAEYHYYQAIRARTSCLICHEHRGPTNAEGAVGPRLAENELMAVVKVVIPDSDQCQPRDPADDGHRYGVSGDARGVCDCSLCDREAAQAPSRSQRRSPQGQRRCEGRNSYRRRV